MAQKTLTAEQVTSFNEIVQSTALHRAVALRLESVDPMTFVMEVCEGNLNIVGGVHGGAIATLVDVASGAVAGSVDHYQFGRDTLVTIDMHVRYVGRPKGQILTAIGKTVQAGRRIINVECRITDETGKLVAVGDTAYMILPGDGPIQSPRE